MFHNNNNKPRVTLELETEVSKPNPGIIYLPTLQKLIKKALKEQEE